MNHEIALPKIQVSKSTALVLLGLGIYLAYLRWLGFGQVAESLDNVNPMLFFAALLLSLLMVAFNALSWRRVAEELDYGASFKDLFLIYLSSIFMNNLIPSGSFSGETARVYFLSKIDGASRFDASFASVAASRIITAVPFILG
ncbi:MAG TPA: flippase-like domain-containing protein, partial [Methanotrichaceae archaeon]|nr:flippase-like domain-containing protein [Methanotrichaceae archaeon]